MPAEVVLHVWRRLSDLNALEFERSRSIIVFDAQAGAAWSGSSAFLRSLRHEYGTSSCIQCYENPDTGAGAWSPPRDLKPDLLLHQEHFNIPANGKLVLVVICDQVSPKVSRV